MFGANERQGTQLIFHHFHGLLHLQGAGCGVFQHANCLGIDALPERHFCELCRAAWADPFWEVKNARIFPPSKLIPTGISSPYFEKPYSSDLNT